MEDKQEKSDRILSKEYIFNNNPKKDFYKREDETEEDEDAE